MKNELLDYESDHVIISMLRTLNKVKQKNYPKLEKGIKDTISSYYSENTKILTRKFYLDVLSGDSDRQTILIGHLYLELFLNELINSRIGKLEQFEKHNILTSFYKKVRFLEIYGILDSLEVNTILTINGIRNKFAHKLFYDNIDINIFSFNIIRDNTDGLKRPKSKKGINNFNRLCIKLIFWWIGLRMTEKHKEVLFLDVKK